MTYIKGSQNVLLFSHRRVGKTSLIQQIFSNIDRSKDNQTKGKRMYQAESLQKINFSNTSQMSIALEALLIKDIILKNN